MAKTALLPALLSILLLPSPSLALTQDFCVADLARSDTPAGYPCKAEANVTAEDFYYRGLATPGKVIAPFGVGLGRAFVAEFPGVNGLGISASRVDLIVGGVVPLHTHPAGSELLLVTQGTMVAGFISALTNTVYTKTVQEGEIFLFPQGLLHFQYNAGKTTAVAFAAYSSANPGLQIVDYALFANNMTSSDVAKVTFLDILEVRKGKALFGGSG